MYLVVIGMFLVAIVGTIWITLWTIQRGERARAAAPRVRSSFGYNADEQQRERFNTTGIEEGGGAVVPSASSGPAEEREAAGE
jgi:hypothetical protein